MTITISALRNVIPAMLLLNILLTETPDHLQLKELGIQRVYEKKEEITSPAHMRNGLKWTPGKLPANQNPAEVWPAISKGFPLRQNFPRC